MCPLLGKETSLEAPGATSLNESVAGTEADVASFRIEATYHNLFWFHWLPVAGVQGKEGMPLTDGSSAVCKAELRGAARRSVC